MAEKTDTVTKDAKVIIVDETTLEPYLTLGLFHISEILSSNWVHLSGIAIGWVKISIDDFAEFITTIKNGNMVNKNNITVIAVRLPITIFFFIDITFPPLFSY
jgi:hypothetical protein